MSELFDEDEDKTLIVEHELVAEVEQIVIEHTLVKLVEARRKLEHLMDEKRLKDELEDFPDDYS